MRREFLLPALCLVGCTLATVGTANSATCTDLLPASVPAGNFKRPLVAKDLVELRDIGEVWNYYATTPILSLSPDGRHVAFQLRRAKVDTNDYCLAMVIVDLDRPGVPRLVDTGGEYIRLVQNIRGLTNYPSGYTEVITAKWSPDGRWIAYRRRDKGSVQAWIAAADGSGARAVTHTAFDVEDLDWTQDGKALLIDGRPGLSEAEAAIDKEGRSGYLFDDRFIPFAGKRPFPRDTLPNVRYRVDIADGHIEPANETKRTVATQDETGAPKNAGSVTVAGDGGMAWTQQTDPGNVSSPSQLYGRLPGGKNTACENASCYRIQAVWWSANEEIVFQNREGWGGSWTGIYAWTPGDATVRNIWRSTDVLLGCQLTGRVLACAHEASNQPRDLITLDLIDGRVKSLFDPNPEFRTLQLGSVERLNWTNDRGIETFGDLVLPPGHQPGDRHPLVLVQYDSRGFLRGGTDDDYPVQLFANSGFAVLSFERPKTVGDTIGGASYLETGRLDRVGWADRRSVLSAMEVGVELAVSKGAIDPLQVGITGQSDGSSAVRFAVLNSQVFKAAAISSCCEDETSLMSTYGAGARAAMHQMGYPLLTDDGRQFWADVSFRRNAARMKTPLLMQLADNEYLSSLESYVALSEQKAPVEMYVFPNEYHQLWQPVHRMAVYNRSIDWFAFWLNGTEGTDPSKQEQYKRWRALRANLQALGADPGK